MTETARFEPLPNGGTRLTDIIQLHVPLPRPLRRIMARQVLLKKYKYDQMLREAARMAQEQSAVVEPALQAVVAPQAVG
jgi:hypothetical protein